MSLTLLFLLLAAASLGLTLVTYLTVPSILRPKRSGPAPTPGISVLKPLCGLDDGLYENLRSFAEQDYPSFELIFGAEDPNDPALALARRLQAAYPQRSIKVIAGAPPLGRNPKITNLASIARYALHDLVLISDSNVRAGRGYLRALAAELSDPRVGLVTNFVAGTQEQTVGARFENLHLNTFVTSTIAGARVLAGHPCVLGKSMLFRLSELKSLGGWRAFRHVLGEDYALGQAFSQAGLKIALSPFLIETVNERWGLRRFVGRHIRWAQIRRRIWLTAYLVELLMYPTPWLIGLLLLSASGEGTQRLSSGMIAILATSGLLLKTAADAWLIDRLRPNSVHLADLAWVPLKDCLVFALWVVAFVKRSVNWRGHQLWIGQGSRLIRFRSIPRRHRATAEELLAR